MTRDPAGTYLPHQATGHIPAPSLGAGQGRCASGRLAGCCSLFLLLLLLLLLWWHVPDVSLPAWRILAASEAVEPLLIQPLPLPDTGAPRACWLPPGLAVAHVCILSPPNHNNEACGERPSARRRSRPSLTGKSGIARRHFVQAFLDQVANDAGSPLRGGGLEDVTVADARIHRTGGPGQNEAYTTPISGPVGTPLCWTQLVSCPGDAC